MCLCWLVCLAMMTMMTKPLLLLLTPFVICCNEVRGMACHSVAVANHSLFDWLTDQVHQLTREQHLVDGEAACLSVHSYRNVCYFNTPVCECVCVGPVGVNCCYMQPLTASVFMYFRRFILTVWWIFDGVHIGHCIYCLLLPDARAHVN